MEERHRVLVAAQRPAWDMLQGMLGGTADLLPVHSSQEALKLLAHEDASVQLVITTIAFDDSRMVEFLQAVKRDARMKEIPFLCTRLLRSVLSDELVRGMRDVCKQCGAIDLVDVAQLAPEAAQITLRAAVMECLAPPGQ